jgi:hypothetical protein
MALTQTPNKDCVLAWDAMPDALQGNLSPRQRQWLDEHLACCEACRGQYAQQQRLQRAMSLPLDLPVDLEAGLQRLLSRIDRPAIAETRESLRHAGWVGRALVAAVLVQAIGLGALGAKLWSIEPEPAYRTLSEEAAPMPAGAIRMVPEPAMALADWDALLHENGLRVVSGPNAVGAYTLVASSGLAERDALLQRLRAHRGVRLAEPVAGTP